jgi:hypothetical protein
MEPVYRQVIPELWRISGALARIHALLPGHPEGAELAVFLPRWRLMKRTARSRCAPLLPVR